MKRKLTMVMGVLAVLLTFALVLAGCDTGNGGGGGGDGDPASPPPGDPFTDPYGIVMAAIPAGTFTMGSPDGVGDSDEKPQHQVTLSAFKMAKHEVTQAQWEAVMGKTIGEQKTLAGGSGDYGEGGNYPMYYVSWYDAVEFCNALSEDAGLTPAYTIDKTTKDLNNTNSDTTDPLKWTVTRNTGANGYRLPTEAEWEYACRGRTITAYYTGDTEDDVLKAAAWYSANADNKTHPVGGKVPNAWGLYDMHGNVWEWCWDWLGSYGAGPDTNPVGASSGTLRVRRGGGWGDPAANLRSACRGLDYPPDRYNNLGFRLVRP